jgi:7-carboxy-7-deazaguanine synthase
MGYLFALNDLYSCVQGEGCQTGLAMVIVRLQGCGVGCPFCDTKETWLRDPAHRVATIAAALGTNPRYTHADADTIAAHVAEHCPGPRWVLVTGGEPAEQPLAPLVDAFQARGYRAALETSGTALGHVGAGFDWVCVSPKVGMPGGKDVLSRALEPADEIKMVVGRPADLDTLDQLLELGTLKPDVAICLQPVSQSEKATQLCLETVKRRGWRLSLQVHKLLAER